MIKTLTVTTRKMFEFKDLTVEVQDIVDKAGINEGLCIIYSPHTTAGITINESADPSVSADIINHLDAIVPLRSDYAHSEGNSAAHIKTSLMGSSESIIIYNRKLMLGTWQGIFFCEFDGPRTRKVHIKLIEG